MSKTQRFTCYGRKDCPNKAPRESMCGDCTRLKYGGWLNNQSEALSRDGRRRKTSPAY